MTNASKYTPEGGELRVALARDGDHAVLSVRDSGIGIDPDQLVEIFDLFMQVDPSIERSLGGLGIGLTMARTLVNLHGGTIEARSDGRGAGSEFTVRLPLGGGTPAPERPDGPPRSGVSTNPDRPFLGHGPTAG